MSITVLDPTSETRPTVFKPADRLPGLSETTIGIISNGKFGTESFFDAFERELRTTWGVSRIVRRTKSNFSAPAETELMDEASRWHALVAGVGD